MIMQSFETILFAVDDEQVATVTLNRPDVMNAFDQRMADEFEAVWKRVRDDDAINAVVLRAAGERAFCSGRDTAELAALRDPEQSRHLNPEHPMWRMGPKLNGVWKPLVTAVHGLAGGGAYYWINESDIVIAADDALFFDPHLSYGLAAGPELVGLIRRIPLAEASRILLMGLDERLSARRAREIGLVSEIVPRADLWDRAHTIAARVASKPSAAVQSTVRTMWESLEMGRIEALRTYPGWYLPPEPPVDRASFVRPTPEVR
jgi:enoyl-CoA hydratase/carnithine racemase